MRPFLGCLVLASCAFDPESTGVVVPSDDASTSDDDAPSFDDDDEPSFDEVEVDTARRDTGFPRDTSGLSACSAVAGRTFLSLEELECGLGPEEVVLCSWSVTLDADGTFSWSFSDVGQSGTWTCQRGFILGDRGGNALPVEAFYDRKLGVLTWDGVLYQ